MFTLHLQVMGVCKEKAVTQQNNTEKGLIQKHCNVLGILFSIRQWDCSHLSIAYSEMKQQQALINKALNKQKAQGGRRAILS